MSINNDADSVTTTSTKMTFTKQPWSFRALKPKGKRYNVPVFGAWHGARAHGRLGEQDDEGDDECDKETAPDGGLLSDPDENDDEEVPGEITRDFTEFARSNIITKIAPPPSNFGVASLLDALKEEGLMAGDTSSDSSGGRYKSMSVKECSSQISAFCASESEGVLKSSSKGIEPANTPEDPFSLPLPALLGLYMGGSLMTEQQLQRLLAELKDVVGKLEYSLTGRELREVVSDGVDMNERVTSGGSRSSESAVKGVDVQVGVQVVGLGASCAEDFGDDEQTESLRGDGAVSSDGFALQTGRQGAVEGNDHVAGGQRRVKKTSPMKKPLLRHLDRGGSGFGSFVNEHGSETAATGHSTSKCA